MPKFFKWILASFFLAAIHSIYFGEDLMSQNIERNDAVYTDDNEYGEAKLRSKLTPIQFYVTQENGTEPPFKNEFWDNKEEGIYVDVVSGKPLFSSRDKFQSGTGWPSFSQPIEEDEIVSLKDSSHGMIRTEVRSKSSDSHLGHVFNDGPKPTGLRYCINSAALRFIPREELAQAGYQGLEKLFD